MKKLLVIMAILVPLSSFAQSNEDVKKITKYEEYYSKTGSIIKFIDVYMPKIYFTSSTLNAYIRIFKSTNDVYFYRLEEDENRAMIEYSDLVEINKAITKLASEVDSDIAANPDYLENKFRTDDGFEVGYYVKNCEANWYLKLERKSGSTVFIKYASGVFDNFKSAQAKIEELKAANEE